MTKTTTAKPFDFGNSNMAELCDTPTEIELLWGPDRAKTGVFLSIVGNSSATFKAYVRAEGNRKIAENARKQSRGEEIKPLTVQENEMLLKKLAIACVVGWRTVVGDVSEAVIHWNGEKVAYSPDAAERFLAQDGYEWAVDQITQATGDLSAFIKA